MSDVFALGVLQAAAELGIDVPAQLSVVGFDDNPAPATAPPPLTTIAQPHEEKGRRAAELLLRAIERGAGPPRRGRRTILPTEVVVRETPPLTAAPRPARRRA